MSTLAQIRAAMKTTLQGITGLNVYGAIEDVVETPAAVLGIRQGNALHPSGDFTGAFARGMDDWHFEIHVFVSRREGGYAQADLDQYLDGSGAKSIRAKLFNDIGLSDTVIFVSGVMNYSSEHVYMKMPHVGATINVRVSTSGA